MSNVYLRNITNNYQDVKLVSLSSWRQAGEIMPRDRNGPYVVMQEGFDPEDMTMTADEFVLGKSGKWLSLGHFYRIPVPERRSEFIFGTAAEVMQMMSDLPSKTALHRPTDKKKEAPVSPETDEMAAALEKARGPKSETGK